MSRIDKIKTKPHYFRAVDVKRYTKAQLLPYRIATLVRFQELLQRGHWETYLLIREAEQLFARLPARPQIEDRNRSTMLKPKERAEAWLWNILDQGRYTPARVVLAMCTTDIFLRRSGAPRPAKAMRHFENVERARAVFHLLRASKKTYTQDFGNGHIKELTVRKRFRFQSHRIARRLTEIVKPIYERWMIEQEAVITSRAYAKEAELQQRQAEKAAGIRWPRGKRRTKAA